MSISDHAKRPLVGVSCCKRTIGGGVFHTVLEKYLVALSDVSGCDVVLVPALRNMGSEGRLDLINILERLDGLLLTGARSMVDPKIYGGNPLPEDMLIDGDRDATTLPLIREAVKRRVPLLAICRGFQELCCALGGTLIQELEEGRSAVRHRAPEAVTYEEKYLPTHGVRCVPGGLLAKWVAAAGMSDCFEVNSLHRQGIATLGDGLKVEARSIDGLIEAASMEAPGQFALGVQWHPEWHLSSHAVNRTIFSGFGIACRSRHREPTTHRSITE